MKLKQTLSTLCLLMLTVGCAAQAQVLTMQAGDSKTLTFESLRSLEKGNADQKMAGVTGTATLSLDRDGKTLTVTLQNLSNEKTGAALYAFELGLAAQQAVRSRAELLSAQFPENARWLGPLDDANLSAGNSVFTFAAHDAATRRFDEFLMRDQPLPPSFLTAGQRGTFVIKLTSSAAAARSPILTLKPMLYFLVPDPDLTSGRRLRVGARFSPNTVR